MNTRLAPQRSETVPARELSSPNEDVRRVVHGAHLPEANATTPPTFRRRVRVLAAILLITLTVYYGSLRKPLGPAAGAWFHSPASTSLNHDATLRIGTFNIHGAKGTDGVRSMERIKRTLRGLDFAGLNEVHGGLPGIRQDQAADLGAALGMSWLYAPTEERWWCDQFGNGALSNMPVKSWQRIPLPRLHGKSFRNTLLVRADHQGRPVNILVTHLDRSDDRERIEQLRTVGELFLALETPAVLMGDLNTDASEPALRKLLEAPGVRDPLSEQLGGNAPRRIDWVLVRGLETVDAGHVQNGASDHPHVWAELAWPAE